MIVKQGHDGLRGFDCNSKVSDHWARQFVANRYTFVCRYVPRSVPHSYDLDPNEVQVVLSAGLAIMPVQHVESDHSWFPSKLKGQQYGENAAKEAHRCGILPGTTVWCDLEGVDPSVRSSATIAYANEWFTQVHDAGFQPGIYLGSQSGVTGLQAYRDLRFTRYWAAYNLNSDRYPVTRGVCLQQRPSKRYIVPEGVPFGIDVDLMMADKIGGFPNLTVPNEDWAPE